MTVQPQRQDSTTNVVNLHAERARRRSREATPPTLEDAALVLLGIGAEAHDFLFLDAADIVAKLDPVYTAIIASLPPEARRRL